MAKMGLLGVSIEYLLKRHFVVSLLLSSQILCVPIETKLDACPMNCICQTEDDGNNLSLVCTDVRLVEVPVTLPASGIQSLDLSNNEIAHLEESSFTHYQMLEYLTLSDNEIESIDSRAFATLRLLLDVDLSYNILHYIPADLFAHNPVLESVSFRGNPLVYVPSDSPFLASPSLLSLDLSYCKLTTLNTFTFSRVPKLQSLDLNSNHLRMIHQDVLDPLTELIVFDLGSNLWDCDCEIVGVLKWLSRRRKSLGLEGEHRPVRCLESGVYKTLWTAEKDAKLCKKQKRILEINVPMTEPPKKIDEESLESKSDWNKIFSWNANTILVFCILPLMLGLATFLALIAVRGVVYWMNSRGQFAEPLGACKVSKTSPFISPVISSKKQSGRSCSDLDSDSYVYSTYHTYERVD